MSGKSLNESVIKKILMSKMFYHMGLDCFRNIQNVEKVAIGIILLQDAVEIFMIALCEHLVISLKGNETLPQYFQILNKEKSIKLSLESDMIKLNKKRVAIKHYGFKIDIDDCKNEPVNVHRFFKEVSEKHFGENYNTISMIDLLQDTKTKEILKKSEDALKNKNYKESQIYCRKAIYLEFEKDYDIRLFSEKSKVTSLIQLAMCKAPAQAQNRDYIKTYVNEPRDYIVVDNNLLIQELLSMGVVVEDYFNIIRLTPPAYYFEDNNKWIIREDFSKDVFCDSNAEYCLRKAVEILLIKQKSREIAKYADSNFREILIKEKSANVYDKASINSASKMVKVDDVSKITSDYKTDSLDLDNKCFYKVFGFLKNDENIFIGYMLEDEVKSES